MKTNNSSSWGEPVSVKLTFSGVPASIATLTITNTSLMRYAVGSSDVGFGIQPLSDAESISITQVQVTQKTLKLTPGAEDSINTNISIQPYEDNCFVEFTTNLPGGSLTITTPVQQNTVQGNSSFCMKLCES